MMDLTFGEQVKIILSRKGMTIKELAETIEARTGKKMSRQNLTQRLGRDNFQEQDMRMIAGILGCPFYLNILDETILEEKNANHTIEEKNESVDLAIEVEEQKPEVIDDPQIEREITIGELNDLHEELEQIAAEKEEVEPAEEIAGEAEAVAEEMDAVEAEPVVEEVEQVAEEIIEEVEPEEAYTEEYAEEVEEEYVPEYTEENLEEYVEEYVPEYEEENSEEYVEEYVPEYAEDNIEEYAQEYIEEEAEEAVEDLLAEMDAIEQEAQDRKREKETREDHSKKNRGWRSYLSFGKKKSVEEVSQRQPEEEQAEETEAVEDNAEYEAEPEYTEVEESPVETPEETAYEEAVSEEDEGSEVIYLDDEDEAAEDGMIESDEEEEVEDLEVGDLNPYTGKEYETNSVRMHPKRIGYVQVYDRAEHKWTDMTEWAFLGYQERKKALLGKDYEPPIYLD